MFECEVQRRIDREQSFFKRDIARGPVGQHDREQVGGFRQRIAIVIETGSGTEHIGDLQNTCANDAGFGRPVDGNDTRRVDVRRPAELFDTTCTKQTINRAGDARGPVHRFDLRDDVVVAECFGVHPQISAAANRCAGINGDPIVLRQCCGGVHQVDRDQAACERIDSRTNVVFVLVESRVRSGGQVHITLCNDFRTGTQRDAIARRNVNRGDASGDRRTAKGF